MHLWRVAQLPKGPFCGVSRTTVPQLAIAGLLWIGLLLMVLVPYGLLEPHANSSGAPREIAVAASRNIDRARPGYALIGFSETRSAGRRAREKGKSYWITFFINFYPAWRRAGSMPASRLPW